MNANPSWRAVALCAALTLLAPASAWAQSGEVDAAPSEVRLLENYSPFDLTMTSVAAAGTIFILAGGGEHVFGSPHPGMGPPTEQSVDWRFTHWANPTPDPTRQWLGGVPDYGGYAMPALAMGFYATGALGHAANDGFFLRDQKHEAVAFAGALGWTMLTVNTLKFMVGRTRPLAVRGDVDAEAFGVHEGELNLSFPSGHSASAAVTSTFLFLDLSDYLVHEVFADSHPALRHGVGWALPLAGAAGLTWTVMYSRIKDQRHWLSDTLTGALIGSGFATIFYVMHFDDTGQPRRRRQLAEDTASDASALITSSYLAPMPGAGPMGLSYGFQF